MVKKAKFTKVIAACMASALLAAMVAFTGCASDSGKSAESSSAASESSAAATAEEGIAVTVAITSPGADGKVTYEAAEYTVEGEHTALDALTATGVEFTSEDSEYGAYVTSIDGLAGEGSSGWTYTVNGEQPTVSADETILNAGDTVEWSYINMEA